MVVRKAVRGLMYGHLLLQNRIYIYFFSRKPVEKRSYWTPFRMEKLDFSGIKVENPVILAISAYFHDSSACILKNGKIIAAADEERFTRKKHDAGFPANAIRFCMKEADVTEVDAVAYFESPMEKLHRIRASFKRNLPSYKLFRGVLESWAEKKLPHKVRKKVREIGIAAPVIFLNHHLCHAASSYLLSPFKKSAILTIDGVGEVYTNTIGIGPGKEIILKKAIEFPDSIGLLYSAVTAFLGFKVNNDEYKVMGLAPYGNPKRYYAEMKSLIKQMDDGSYRLNMDPFDFEAGESMCNEKMGRLFGIKKREKEGEVRQAHKDIAAALQTVTEKAVLKILEELYKETKCDNLCLAGGVALNSVLNGKILSETGFKRIFIQPSAGDSGTVMGAAHYLYHMLDPNAKRERMVHSYYGPEYTDKEIKGYLDENKVKYYEFKSRKELLDKTAALLVDKKVVGWFHGRMEWGPRALGNRSILASPCYEDMRDILNAKVKHREMFRPFAPVVCADDASKYFECDMPLPEPADYMLMVYPIRKKWHRKIPAVTHVDGSGRLQSIRRNQNPLYYDLIKIFGRKSGIPMLVNTSFNIRGEPIICTPHDAYRCMMGTGIDCLVMGKFLIRRKDNPKDMWNSEARE